MTNANFFPTWHQIERSCHYLANKVKRLKPFDAIVAVTRGGLVPAALLSEELGIIKVDTVCVTTYQGKVAKESKVFKWPQNYLNGRFLVVDDICDTGRTVKALRPYMTHSVFVCLFAKPEGRDLVDEYVDICEENIWIVFPWETYEDNRR